MRRLTAAALLGMGCASPGMPPGGPPDAAAPQIVAIIPDSGTVGRSPKEVLFRFDEVVSERPQSATSLDALFLISPRDGAPEASWHRDAIGVRPRRGWRPNTPYTVIMLPGLADLRGNIRNTGASTFFSTGGPIPRTRLSGVVFDWAAGTPAAGALVESFVRPDSLRPFIAVADSNGAFTIPYLPPARYTVRAYLDRNKNFGLDVAEPWDTVGVQVTDSATTTILVFAHDSVPPRIRDLFMVDSVSIQVAFDRPIDPSQTLAPANFAVVGPDSVPLPISSVGPPPADSAVRPIPPVPGAPRPAGVPPSPAPARRDTTVVSKNRPLRRFTQRLSVASREGTGMEYGAWVELKTTESGRTRFERGYFARPEGGGKGSDPTSEGGPRLTLARYQRLMPDGTLYEYPVGQEGAPLLDEDVSAMDLIDFAGASVSDSLFSDTLRVGRAAVACQVKQVRRYGKEDWQGADSTYVNRAVMTRTSWQSPGVPVTGYARSMVEVSTERVSTGAPVDSADTTAAFAPPDSAAQVPPPTQDPSPKRGEFFYRAELTLLDIGHDAVPEITQVPEPAPEDGIPRARRVIK